MGMLRSGAESELIKTLDYHAEGGTIQVNGQACAITKARMQVNYQIPGYRTQVECTLPNKQTYKNVEIIIVDDGSSDDTPALIASRYAADHRVKYMTQHNQGASAARNTGLRAAHGDYIALLDSDDVWKSWKIELQLHALKKFADAGMIWTDMEAVRPDGELISPRFLRTMYYNSYRWFPTNESLFSHSEDLASIFPKPLPAEMVGRVYCGDIASQMVMGNLVHTSTVLLRRTRVENVGGFDEGFRPSGEDFDFHLRTCRVGPVAFADVASIKYCVGAADQLTQPRYNIYIARNFLRTIELVLKDAAHPINLPAWMIAAVQAEAHAWIGRETLAIGGRRSARKHLIESLKHRAFSPYALSLLVLSYGPSFTYPVAKALIRTAKSALRASNNRHASAAG